MKTCTCGVATRNPSGVCDACQYEIDEREAIQREAQL